MSGPSASRGTIEPAPNIVDVPPTVFAHLGVPVDPAWGWDGRAVGLKPAVSSSDLTSLPSDPITVD